MTLNFEGLKILAKKRKFGGLTFTIAITFFILVIFVMVLASIIELYISTQAQKEFVFEKQQFIAKNAADEVNGFIQEKFSILKTTAGISGLADNSSQKIVLEKLSGLDISFRKLMIFDNDGHEQIIISRQSSFARSDFLKSVKEKLLSTTKNGDSYISPVYINEITNEPMVVMAVPIKDVIGNIKGTLAAETNLKFMWDLVAGMKIGNTGFAYVVDSKGNLIAFSDISRVLKGENLIKLEQVKKFIDDLPSEINNAAVSKGILGNDVVSNFVPLGSPDWAVVVEMPVAEAYENIIRDIFLMLTVIMVSIAIAIIGGFYLSKRIAKPIVLLRDVANKIGRGELDTKIEINSKDEIGELALAFRQMTDDLKKSREKLEQYSKGLEDQVAQRTNELQTKVDELERFNKLVIERELKMVELKNKIEELQNKLDNKN